ncbi:hypothetical protein F7D20_07965 [Prevotella copri]|uniref:WG repeat-containing protein n=1 Tax=Segatella copri TaxID=165179 RepID=A0A6A7WBL2_9BACT|nr:hypothetical protein [Segatella copri]MQP11889.1 hypothetical protein [Segatella copri]
MRKICLFVLLQINAVLGWAQVTYTLSSHREYVDKVINDAITEANRIKIEDSKLSPLMKFAKKNIASDDKFADFDGSNSSIGLCPPNKSWRIGNRNYRLPTPEEMIYIAPFFTSPKDMPRFTKSGKLYNNVETLNIENSGETTVYSDYMSKENVIYGLRFKKRADNEPTDNPYRSAYRYTLSGGALIIGIKQLGSAAGVKKVKDIADPKWWAAQNDIFLFTLPVKKEGVAYCTSGSSVLLIDKEAVRMSLMSNTSNFLTRPYIDIDKTYAANSTFMHYNISGTNITVDKTIDPTIVKHIGTELPNIDVYMRSCPSSVNLEYEGGKFPYGDIVSERLGSGALIYHITLKKNFSSDKRTMVFKIKNAAHIPQLEGKFTMTQMPIDINNVPDSIPADYLANNYLDTSGSLSGNSNSDIGQFDWDSAKSYANSVEVEERMKQVLSFDDLDNVPLKYYHLPSLNNLSCILPSHTKSFTEKYDLEEIDSMAYGIYDQDPNVVTSSYYSKGDGVIYAIRPIKSWSSAAFRYQYKPNEGLVVDMVPLGSAAFKVKSAQEISDGEIFSRSDVRTRIFRSNEKQSSGGIWTSTESPYAPDEAMAYEYDKNGIYLRSESKSKILPVIPFLGEEKTTEEESDEESDEPVTRKPKRVRRVPRKTRTSRPAVSVRKIVKSPSKGNNHIIVVDKTK